MAFNKEKVMDAARKFVDKGQIDKAVKEYLRIVHEDPKDVRVWLKIGDLYAKKGAKQEAIDTYEKVARFYCYFLAFMGSMLGIVLSGNLIQLVFFWELTTLFSFLLIGYWYQNTNAREGARMALQMLSAAKDEQGRLLG